MEVEVLILAPDDDNFDDLLHAASSSTDFWDNPADDARSPMRYEVWRCVEDPNSYEIFPEGGRPSVVSELLWRFDAESYEDARRQANSLISQLRAKEMEEKDQGEAS
jgi:hypothetical protein